MMDDVNEFSRRFFEERAEQPREPQRPLTLGSPMPATLSLAQWRRIVDALGTRPYVEVKDIVESIQRQAGDLDVQHREAEGRQEDAEHWKTRANDWQRYHDEGQRTIKRLRTEIKNLKAKLKQPEKVEQQPETEP